MAIFHLTMKPMARSSGRSVIGSIAYRSGENLTNLRDGVTHDYSRRDGVESATLVLPGERAEERGVFWNRVEAHHKRGDAVPGREIQVALPAELDPDQRRALAVRYGQDLSARYGVAVDVAVHRPHGEGDERNHHAHIVMSACRVEPDGTLGKKVAELDPIHCKRHQLPTPAEYERGRWEELTNTALAQAQCHARIDHRSRAEQGLDGSAQEKMGPAVTAIERKAQREARAEGREYEPVTDRARERSRLLELRDVALQKAQQALEWGVEYAQRMARRMQSPFSREALAAVGTQEIERQSQERAQAQARLQLQQEQAQREAVQREQLRQRQVERDQQRQIDHDHGPSLGR
ncbi:MobA/MobL family protein [Sphingomonas sp. 10B4]|uniref:MobA/MobL family protein n=1 Tax=Sphingomonas sp. 10B4 TaxID=3048575 RepID=UPI002AB50816|nr:MobA/MobL family protein [Sphingomonas sp. 10B4]MDY7526262.1 MobA/MobL family protein [Sphingomonas sp. 10B4]MEB0284491.1 MobA/MobL family protein [Sphingomonas sp. 10B4]